MNARKSLLLAVVLATMALLSASAALAQTPCDVPSELKVLLVEAQWKFDVKSGKLEGIAVVRNISDSDVIAPGITVGVFGVSGSMTDSVAQRGKEARLAPGKAVKVNFSMQLKQAPASILIAPFEGIAST
ncbi:MAG TPA: hypothetical protein ENN89_01630 [Synergistetes bacterium]|nr:hypothetical protein [Synergistota bacterium]